MWKGLEAGGIGRRGTSPEETFSRDMVWVAGWQAQPTGYYKRGHTHVSLYVYLRQSNFFK